jgi:hypothetical protein
MRLRYLALLLPLCGALLGQTQIGGGTCTSASLSGAYTFTLTGRQVATSGAFIGVFQANGTATFDGASKVTMTMNASTAQAAGTNLSYSGAYTVQASCVGSITITAGDTATFNLMIYNQGRNFLITGTDASYDYSGGGGTQPTACMTSLLSGVYAFNTNGFTLASGVIGGLRNASGVMQLDGKGSLTVNFTSTAPGQSTLTLAISGSYVLTGGCSGTGTLSDSLGSTYSLAFAISSGSTISTSAFDVVLGQAGKLLFTGTAHAVYGQPVAAGGAE